MTDASDVSVPRRRLTRKIDPSQTKFSQGLVRQRSFELDDDELQATQLQRVAIITIDGSERAFPTNDEFLVPDIHPQDEFPEHLLRQGIQDEMNSITSFETFIPVRVDELPVPVSEVIPSRFVNKWKNSKVKSRLVVQAYNQHIEDQDDIYAATPLISILKVLLLLSLSLSWSIVGFDVNTAFLHASIPVTSNIFIWPPKEYASEDGSVVWQLKKSLYGLRTSPKAWQDHVFNVFNEAQLIQMRSECNVWRNQQSNFFIVIYVDDIVLRTARGYS